MSINICSKKEEGCYSLDTTCRALLNFTYTYPKAQKKFMHNKVIRKVRRLGVENGQFRHNRASNAYFGMKFYKTK
jgi:hypothetical protein